MIEYIDYDSFSCLGKLNESSLRDTILERVVRNGGAVIVRRERYPLDAHEFRHLLVSLNNSYQVDGHGMDRFVEVEQRDEIVHDQKSFFEFPYKSGYELSCHTDASFNREPFDIVALFCVRNEPSYGGRSVLFTLNDLLGMLSRSLLDRLSRIQVQFEFGKTTILTRENWGLAIRYHRREIDAYTVGADALKIRDTVDEIDKALGFDNASAMVDLLPGECLIIDNRRVLHGRTQLAPKNRRLLVRGRCFVARD